MSIRSVQKSPTLNPMFNPMNSPVGADDDGEDDHEDQNQFAFIRHGAKVEKDTRSAQHHPRGPVDSSRLPECLSSG